MASLVYTVGMPSVWGLFLTWDRTLEFSLFQVLFNTHLAVQLLCLINVLVSPNIVYTNVVHFVPEYLLNTCELFCKGQKEATWCLMELGEEY